MVFENGVRQVSEWRATVVSRSGIEEGFANGRLHGRDGLCVHGNNMDGLHGNGPIMQDKHAK
ncbi:hypothetical protein RchiOBHm_Chr1g0325331 [Rosa chinensis]|uniref:Uncharacterized protein n=1 Tax=Rosa chinensis TaxID=74649 RepID=A0A2P6SA20_ROSCH|nr:hypothetical protein RchiOBHm_Chr1g0325331 [Rosa chinensis]